MFLETERLALRPFVPEDMDDLAALDADPEVMRFLTQGQPVEVRPDRWAAIEKSTGDIVGWFGLRGYADGAGEVEIGFRLRRSAWGNGYATEGSRALIAKCFAEPGIERVWGQTMAVNVASRRVLEKVGMRYVRTFHLEWDDPLPGTERGEVEYEILRSLA